ncbi:MAG: Kelch repeat-containing protein [Opitutaceae bacterium]
MSFAQRAGQFAQRLIDNISPGLADKISDERAKRRHARSGGAWRWELSRPCPLRRCEAGGAQVGSRLILAGGLESMDHVHDTIDVFDMEREAWIQSWPLPRGMPHSHHGMVSDARRFIYLAAGQIGPQCAPAVADVFSLDAETGRTRALPPLPGARYAPAAALLDGRLHVIGGSAADRSTPLDDHWSIGVRDGEATDDDWRAEPPAPIAATHCGHVVAEGAILLLGGQQGDVKPIPGDAAHTCDFNTPIEPVLRQVHRFRAASGSWERLADMPEALSHIEGCAVVHGSHLIVFAGTEERFVLSNTIKVLDLRTGLWRIAGTMPRYFKNAVVGRIGRKIFFATGQRSKSSSDRFPGRVSASVWKTWIPESLL